MAKETPEKTQQSVKSAGAGHQDPICGRRLASTRASFSAEYKKRRYYFCSARCQDEFRARTEKFRLVDLARKGALLTPGKVRWGIS